MKSLQEFISLARANPGKLTFASTGIGTLPHLAGELLKRAVGIEMTHVPYRGVAAGAMNDLVAGRVDAMFNALASLLQPVRTGQVRALAVGDSAHRPRGQGKVRTARNRADRFDAGSTCRHGPGRCRAVRTDYQSTEYHRRVIITHHPSSKVVTPNTRSSASGRIAPVYIRAVSNTVDRTGDVRFDGESLGRRPPETVARLGIAHVPEGRGIITQLTVDENLRLGAYLRRDRQGVRADYERVFDYFPILRERRELSVRAA